MHTAHFGVPCLSVHCSDVMLARHLATASQPVGTVFAAGTDMLSWLVFEATLPAAMAAEGEQR